MDDLLTKHYETALTKYANNEFYDDMLQAKNEFYMLTGKIDEDDDDYELRMSSFNDWYLFQYVTPKKPESPIFRYIKEHNLDEDLQLALRTFNHSIFEFQGDSITSKRKMADLLHGHKILISKNATMPGLVKNDLFIGRSLKFKSEHYLLPGLTILPKEAKSIILKECETLRTKRDLRQEFSFLFRTEFFKTKFKNFGHIGYQRIFDYRYK
jgi:hypothetical protein